jgi:chaperonin GroES
MDGDTKQVFKPVLDLSFKGKAEELAKKRNIAEDMDWEDRQKIGLWAKNGMEQDKSSRSKWETWYAEAIKLALQVKEAKTFPWPGSSNVKFPLLTIACLNAHAQAYPALISGDLVAKCRVIGDDPDGQKKQRAERVSRHMSYQLLETMPWEEQTDKQILVHYLMGTTFKKVYRDNAKRQNCSDFVMPQDLIVNYWARDMDSCPRASHYIPLTKNEVMENINAQVFLEPDEPITPQDPPVDPLTAARDKAQLTTPPPDLQLINHLYEQSCWMDLDQDGYDEPYAVTFEGATGFVFRIHARYLSGDVKRDKKGSVLRIEAENYYEKYVLIPSPDGGFYGMGLGRFLAPINDAVDSVINQMIDGAHMKMLGGGWLGRGVRLKAGDSQFRPYEWKPLDTPGDDIRKNIFPLPTGDVPAISLELLKYLVEYGERIGSSGDLQMGKLPGQNTKAETASIANENGKMIFNSTYKRYWRSMKGELKKLYRLNFLYQEDETFYVGEKQFQITKQDYLYPDSGIVPAADPNMVSKTDKKERAMLVHQTAQSMGGGGHDMDAVIMDLYQAFGVQDIKRIYPGLQAKPPPPNPKMMHEQTLAEKEKNKAQDIKAKAQIGLGTLMVKAKESQAKIFKMMAESAKLMKEAEGVDVEHKIQLLQIGINAEVEKNDDVLEMIKIMMDALKEDSHGDNSNGMEGMAPPSGDKGMAPQPQAA